MSNKELVLFKKDNYFSLGVFEAASKILSQNYRNEIDLEDRVSIFISDFDMINALIFEKYIDMCKFSDLPSASEALVLADISITRIRQNQEWTLLSNFKYLSLYAAFFSTKEVNLYPRFSIYFI